MLAARMEIEEIKKRETELEEEEKTLQAAAKLYQDIQKELRTRQQNEKSLRHNIRDLKKHPVVDAGIKGFNATARTRAISNPASPAKTANVTSFPGVGITNNHSKSGEILPNFDLDIENDEDEEALISSEDGVNNEEDKIHFIERSEQRNEKLADEKLEEQIVDREKETETEEGNSLNGKEVGRPRWEGRYILGEDLFFLIGPIIII